MKIRTIRIRKDHPVRPNKEYDPTRRMHAILVIVTIVAIAALLFMRASLL